MSADQSSPENLANRAKLALTLMNQAHAQQLTNDPAQITAAVASYEQAIAILRTLPHAENPALANSLGAAWMNRGQLLHRLRSNAQIAPALESFQEALAVFQSIRGEPNPWVRRNFLGTLLNRAVLLMDLSEHRGALADARLALQLAPRHEREELVDADLSLKLRHLACNALIRLIAVAPATEQPALASEATDLVDEGLALAREWSARGDTSLAVIAARLFRFGAQLYRVHQPHFLAEFVTEQIDATPASADVIEFARENLELALATRPTEPFLTVGDPASERHVQTARDLQAALEKISALAPPPTRSAT